LVSVISLDCIEWEITVNYLFTLRRMIQQIDDVQAQCSANWATQSGRFEYVIFRNRISPFDINVI
jgi:hypothetical protein